MKSTSQRLAQMKMVAITSNQRLVFGNGRSANTYDMPVAKFHLQALAMVVLPLHRQNFDEPFVMRFWGISRKSNT